MGNFFEDLVHSVIEYTLTEEEQATITAKFHKLKREVIEDVRTIFPHGQILPESSGRGIRIRLPPGPVGDDSGDVVDDPGLPALPDVMEAYATYVNNELPTYLVHVPEKKLVSRQDVKKMFRRDMMTVTEADIDRVIKEAAGRSSPTREEAIRAIVRGKLKYATFSHRWLERGEPTFRDILMSFRPAGYGKLANFCEKAAEYGCCLAWSDTCCINKDSSTELEEAIRSMFKWYRDAHVCIAYLAEATAIDDIGEDVWFTRGWTLQELLAPRTMKFYGKGWVPLTDSANDKQNSQMLDSLSQATGISHHDLRLFRPGTRNVHEKMMWASKRTTTRVEDMAYSLIGIFDVSLTIAYGEGQRAFYRLMESIINRCGEWEIMAWAGRSSADSAALPESPRCYKALREAHNTAPSDDGTHCGVASHERSPSARSSDERQKREAPHPPLPPSHCWSALQRSSSPISAHSPAMPCLHFPLRPLAARSPGVWNARSRLPGTRTCEVFPPTPAAHTIAGNSHSHLSPLLPSPPSAWNDVQRGLSQRVWRGDRHFIMTKRGLQLKLLILDIPSSSLKLFEGTGGERVECTRYEKCTVGVVDYWCFDTSGLGVLRPEQDHLCLLLRSDPFDPYGEWEKGTTTELLFVRSDTEMKKDLSMLWL